VVIAVLSLGMLTVTAHRLGERGEQAPVGGVQTAGAV
jgi:hypothetical protein